MEPLPEALDAMESSSHGSMHFVVRAPCDCASVAPRNDNSEIGRNEMNETISLAQSCLIGLLRWLVPPHRDNEKAADYLRTEVGKNDTEIQWAAVRPDSLFDEDSVSAYELHPSPTRSAIFNPGRTSRINVAHFTADLITNHDAWEKWKGQMPVIYNQES